MTVLPEKIRRTLEKLVSEMRIKEDIYGIGLFGSWSRGDATPSSDVDLFILNKGNFPHEYVERVVVNDLLIDLNHVPKAWIQGPIPPEMDQKLYEMQVLYDRDWSLTNTKLLMDKCYGSPERVEIRTEAHIIDSDVYLSRATSAYSRDDYPSAYFFAIVALEAILKVLMETAFEQFSDSRFVEKVEASTAKLDRQRHYSAYLRLARLDRADSIGAREKLKYFKMFWDEAHILVDENPRVLQSAHFKVRTKLEYYLNLAFLQGVMMRATSMIDSGRLAEMFHYLDVISLDVLENYVCLKALIGNLRVDYTTLMRSLRILEKKNPRNYDYAVQLLGLKDGDKALAANGIAEAREVILQIRRERKTLIKKRFTKS